MTFMAFILGLVLGGGICLWREHQLKRRLKKILLALTDSSDLKTSFPVTSLIRREIIRLKEQHQQLKQKLDIWREAVDQSPIGYLHVDKENQLLWCNQQARQLLRIARWQPGQIRLLLELVRSYELDQLVEQTRLRGQPQTREWLFQATDYSPGEKSGGTHSLALKASSYPLANEQVGIFIENQQPLIELTQARDRAFSDLFHELRTPLTSIALVAETCVKRLQNPERRWLERMLKETERLTDLVQNWLEISQLQEDPSQHLNYQTVELRELIFSSWETLEPLAKEKEVNLQYKGGDRLELQADRGRLIQVFLNLFDNAIKYSPAKANIYVCVEVVSNNSTLETLPQASSLHISIIDAGSGFAASDLPYVFERLYRGDPSRARQVTDGNFTESPSVSYGNGLGLPLVQKIIQAHGGSIVAKNHPSTGGAWIEITIPYR